MRHRLCLTNNLGTALLFVLAVEPPQKGTGCPWYLSGDRYKHACGHVHCMWLTVSEHLNQCRLTILFFVFLTIAINNSWYFNHIIYLRSPSSVCLFKALILCSHWKGTQWNCILCFNSWIFLSLFAKVQDLFVFLWAPKRQTNQNTWESLKCFKVWGKK